MLDVDRHREFLEARTGERLTEDPPAADCSRVGNRLEGFIDEHGDRPWPPTSEAAAAAVDAWKNVYWLARFFRTCNEQCSGPDPAPLQRESRQQ